MWRDVRGGGVNKGILTAVVDCTDPPANALNPAPGSTNTNQPLNCPLPGSRSHRHAQHTRPGCSALRGKRNTSAISLRHCMAVLPMVMGPGAAAVPPVMPPTPTRSHLMTPRNPQQALLPPERRLVSTTDLDCTLHYTRPLVAVGAAFHRWPCQRLLWLRL